MPSTGQSRRVKFAKKGTDRLVVTDLQLGWHQYTEKKAKKSKRNYSIHAVAYYKGAHVCQTHTLLTKTSMVG